MHRNTFLDESLQDEPEPRRRGGVGLMLIRGLGQTLITLGVVVLLFAVYEVYVTDIFGARKQAAASSELDRAWAETVVETVVETEVVQAPGEPVDPAKRKPKYETFDGKGFAKIRIPALGSDYVRTIIEGTDPDALFVGPGHYVNSQYPGEQGNFAVAGHRVSKGSPFNDLGLLKACDALVIETQDDWFVYRVLPMAEDAAGWDAGARAHCEGVEVQKGAYQNVWGREITLPSDYAQVLPIPHVSSREVPKDAQRLITLTTCHPQFSDAERMIVHGVLVRTYAKADGFLPTELSEA